MFEVTVRMLKGSVNINNVSMSNYGAQNSEYTLEIGKDILNILNDFVERGILEIVDTRSMLLDEVEKAVEPDPEEVEKAVEPDPEEVEKAVEPDPEVIQEDTKAKKSEPSKNKRTKVKKES